MALEVVTGNHAAGYALSAAGEANRGARGVVAGAYPITPQTEIIEYAAKFKFTKGRIVPVESEHSAMGVCIGASMTGARSFTASSANGLSYMTENIFTAGFYRCPIVLAAVNRTLGPPWNIETNQEVLDTILLAFRLAEDHRILMPALVAMDAFIMSHTQMNTELPEQELVDAYLPELDLPHRLNHEHPVTVGGIAWPQETLSMRVDTDAACQRIPEAYEEHRKAFKEVFGRDVGGFIEPFETEDAEQVLIASGSMASTTREVVKRRRKAGEKIGMVKVRAFRPFPGEEMLEACAGAAKVAVLDRNYSSGTGGLFWHSLKAAAQGARDDLLIQNYLAGVCGGDVTPDMIDEVVDDLARREREERPIWKGIET
ncbi:MAG: pyruvate ferredoxin oxidoreductase [Planctomycetota bacterium]|jgi:pyruvate/2-oxoacid:ferredoxin oxidoreductase alpha subunit